MEAIMDANRPNPDLQAPPGYRPLPSWLNLLVFVGPLTLLSHCGSVPSPAPGAIPPARAVQVASADRSPRPILSEVVGTVRSVREATMAPLLSGTVTEVRVGIGSSVRAGDVLVRLSAREVDARLEQANALSEQATREHDRALTLRDERAISVAQYEAATSEWNVARARQAEARTLAERTVLRAPFAGVITSKMVNVGETALPGQRLLVVEGRSALRFEARVAESAGDDLRIGDALAVRIDGLEQDREARVAEIQPAADDATRTRLVKLDLAETRGLRPGQFGRLLLPTGRSLAVTVPSGAVARHGQLESVFVVEAGAARLRLVRTGRERDGRVEISAGLSGGEKVALAADLADGQRVEEVR
jgi:RND family efflux transporter MFP subunit